MRRMLSSAGLATAATLVAFSSCVGCSAPRVIPPAPVAPAPVPVPPPAPAPVTPAGDWRDWPVTPGTWTYRQDARGSIGLYGVINADADFTIRCDRAERRIYLSRRVSAPAGPVPFTVRTSSMLSPLTAQPTGGSDPYVAVALDVRDPVLDAMSFSRGRFIVETAGMSPLVVPAWAEVPRVIEDCRG